MEKNADNMNISIDEEIMDGDMEKILAILHDIPEVPIPDRFEQRFSEALAAEGIKIREERRIKAAGKKRNWYLKTAAAAAACFVVVFAAVSMYNDGGGNFLSGDISDGTASEESVVDGQFDSSVEDLRGSANKEVQMAEEEMTAPVPLSAGAQSADNNSGQNDSGPSEQYYATASAGTEPDTVCREGSKYLGATGEYLNYKRLVEEYLAGYDFELVDSRRDSVSGRYLFEVRIITDPEGQPVDAPLVLIGEQGEIYEQQAEQQSAGGEAADSEGEPAENGSEGESAEDDPAGGEPQVGSD